MAAKTVEAVKSAKKGRKPQPIADLEKKVDMYFNQELSLSEIAKKYNMHPKQVQRELIRAGHTLRNRSTAQKNRLASGKAEHPTEGKQLSEETKIKISEAVYEAWKDLDPAEVERRRQVSKDNYEKRDDKEEFSKAGMKAIKETSVDGSKFEKFMADQLNIAGYFVLVHQKHVIQNASMHLDILMPDQGIAIEIDGPSHYSNVWSDEDLARVKTKDKKKNGLLVANGYSIIRVKIPSNPSKRFMRVTTEAVLNTIQDIIINKTCKLHNIDTL